MTGIFAGFDMAGGTRKYLKSMAKTGEKCGLAEYN
jgi:hypothetical protein